MIKNNTNKSYLISFPKVPFLTAFDAVIDNQANMGKLTALRFNWDISNFLFIVKITFAREMCPALQAYQASDCV